MDARARLGRTGEDLAVAHYRRRGYTVLDRNYRCSGGEIDVVLRRGKVLVFCEVKARSSDRFGAPAEAVHPLKQDRIRRAAANWLVSRRPGRVDVRFDVFSVIVRAGRIEVGCIPDAF
jgi:putative endonuclease